VTRLISAPLAAPPPENKEAVGGGTAFAAGARQAQGFDGALAALLHAPYGEILLGAVASGLIIFGAYSALCAKWNKIGSRGPA
jgi:hypothetical protein